MLCLCGKRVFEKVVTTPGVNRGKKYLGCDTCNFFHWGVAINGKEKMREEEKIDMIMRQWSYIVDGTENHSRSVIYRLKFTYLGTEFQESTQICEKIIMTRKKVKEIRSNNAACKPFVTIDIDGRECLQRCICIALQHWNIRNIDNENMFTCTMPKRGPMGDGCKSFKNHHTFHTIFPTFGVESESTTTQTGMGNEKLIRLREMEAEQYLDEILICKIAEGKVNEDDFVPFRELQGSAYEIGLERNPKSGEHPYPGGKFEGIDKGGSFSLESFHLRSGDSIDFRYDDIYITAKILDVKNADTLPNTLVESSGFNPTRFCMVESGGIGIGMSEESSLSTPLCNPNTFFARTDSDIAKEIDNGSDIRLVDENKNKRIGDKISGPMLEDAMRLNSNVINTSTRRSSRNSCSSSSSMMRTRPSSASSNILGKRRR